MGSYWLKDRDKNIYQNDRQLVFIKRRPDVNGFERSFQSFTIASGIVAELQTVGSFPT